MLSLSLSGSAIADFQREHTDHLGVRLLDDGKIGKKTQWALDLSLHSVPRQQIIARALGFVGTCESPPLSNRSPTIDIFTRRCGALGLPWCAAFVSWCISLPGYPEIKEASVQRLSKLLPNVTEPLPADVVYYLHSDGTGHCGLLLGSELGSLMTVEGNNNGAVRVVTRQGDQVKFLRSVAPTQMPGIPPGLPFGGNVTR